jgi:hypothetical protein
MLFSFIMVTSECVLYLTDEVFHFIHGLGLTVREPFHLLASDACFAPPRLNNKMRSFTSLDWIILVINNKGRVPVWRAVLAEKLQAESDTSGVGTCM